jgi:adenine phosphoribosyltransferase
MTELTTSPDGAGPAEVSPEVVALLSGKLRDVPDFPQPGVLFKDITPLLADGEAFAVMIRALADLARRHGTVDLVAGIEARGFILASALALELGCGLLPVRKAGKLPPPTISRTYDLEYGTATIEVPSGPLAGRSVFLIDDVLATGGTLAAARDLLVEAGAQVVGAGVLLEIGFLGGRARVPDLDLQTLLEA